MQPDRIGAIDGLRGVAALTVALLHYQNWFVGYYPLQWGNIPTQLFFILSGYILTMKYEAGLRSGATTVWAFIVQRVSRLWPLHIFTLLLFVATEWLFWNYYGRFHVLEKDDTPFAFILNVLMIHNWGFPIGPGFNKPSWSISSELAVNLLWMLALIYWGWTWRVALAAVLALSALMLIGSVPLNYNVYNTVFGVSYGILRTAVGFALGCMLCWYVHDRRGISTLLSGAVQISLIVFLALFAIVEPYGIDWLFSLVLLPAITLVALKPSTITARLMSSAPFRWLGRISYSVYLLHLPIGNLMSLAIVWGIGLPPAPYVGFVWLALVLAISTASLHWIERPGIALTRALASYRRVVPVRQPN